MRRTVRAALCNQALWSAGHALTTGGFLLYFARELGGVTGRDREAMNLITAFLLVVPETVGVAALLSRQVVKWTGSRKRVYVTASLSARAASVLIPLLAFPEWRPPLGDPLWWMIGCLAAAEAAQAVGYVAYLSWLSDLVPARRWGWFFAIRNVVRMLVLLCVPTVAGFLRDWWRRGVPPEVARWLPIPREGLPAWWERGLTAEGALWAYVVAFGIGLALLLASLVPILRLPDVPLPVEAERRSDWSRVRQAWRDRSMRLLLVHQWWLAVSNGITQAAFFGFLFGTLHVGLGTFYALYALMRAVKIPVSHATGWLCDRADDKWVLFWGVCAASSALVFWLLATPEQWWWVACAYGLWGCFAAVNIAGRNLTLKLAPPGDNAMHLALFRHVAGLLAGASGLLGGFWLDRLVDGEFAVTMAGFAVGPFRLLFAVSLCGRLTSALWLLPVRQPSVRNPRLTESEAPDRP